MSPMPRTNDLRRQDPPSHQADLPRICSSDLLRGGNLLLIEHAGERYYLRMTRHNKLILTK